LFEENLK